MSVKQKTRVAGVDDLLAKEARRSKLEKEYNAFFIKHPEMVTTIKIMKGAAAMLGFCAGIITMALIWVIVYFVF